MKPIKTVNLEVLRDADKMLDHVDFSKNNPVKSIICFHDFSSKIFMLKSLLKSIESLTVNSMNSKNTDNLDDILNLVDLAGNLINLNEFELLDRLFIEKSRNTSTIKPINQI